MNIALIEDNVLLWENIETVLKLKGIEVSVYTSVEEFDEELLGKIDVLVMDINLPQKQGTEYLVELRERQVEVPIVLLTSQNTSSDIVAGFEKWADDYISKPFNFDEFIVRLQALAKRKKGIVSSNIRKVLIEGIEFEIHPDMKRVKKDGEGVYLATLEFDLFLFLLEKRGKIIDRATIYEEVWWEFDKYQLSRSVDVYVWYLRKKLGKDIIKTQKSLGYFIEQ